MFTVKSRERLSAFIKFASKHYLREAVALVLAGVSFGVGFSFIFTPSAHKTPTFRVANEWADPRVSGFVLVIIILIGMLSFLTDHMKSAAVMAFFAMLYFFGLSLAILLAAVNGGVPSAIYTYLGYGVLSFIVLFACLYGEERPTR